MSRKNHFARISEKHAELMDDSKQTEKIQARYFSGAGAGVDSLPPSIPDTSSSDENSRPQLNLLATPPPPSQVSSK